MKHKTALFILIAVLFPLSLFALDVPSLEGRVTDKAGIFPSKQLRELENSLATLESRTSIQMAVLTIPSLKGDDLEEFSIRTVDKWKLGQEGKDNGILLLLAVEDRKVRLEVGYGLESLLTDAKSGFIVREIMIPHFSRGNFADGVEAGVSAVAGVVSGDSDISVEEVSRSQQSERSSGRTIPFNLIVILFIIVFNSFGRMGRRRRGGLFNLLLLNSLLGSSRRSGGSFGGGGFGGGGGGFSGGGGGFGGGGASGSW